MKLSDDDEKMWWDFYFKCNNVRCCDCKFSKTHPRGNEYYTHVCTFHKRDGITIPHKGDERVWCTGFVERQNDSR